MKKTGTKGAFGNAAQKNSVISKVKAAIAAAPGDFDPDFLAQHEQRVAAVYAAFPKTPGG